MRVISKALGWIYQRANALYLFFQKYSLSNLRYQTYSRINAQMAPETSIRVWATKIMHLCYCCLHLLGRIPSTTDHLSPLAVTKSPSVANEANVRCEVRHGASSPSPRQVQLLYGAGRFCCL